MKLNVLGATGGVGRQIVTHALADGHQVTAVVRAGSLKPIVRGADAVLSGIGPAHRRDPLKPASTSARAAAEAMAATGMRRILVVSAGPLNRSGPGQSMLTRRVVSPLLWAIFRDLYVDLGEMEAVLRERDLDWTAVRPPRLTDKPGVGRYRHAIDAGSVGPSVARADLARAMLDFVAAPQTYGHAVGVSN